MAQAEGGGGGAPAVVVDHLDAILALSQLRESGKAELLDVIESLRGRKCLVVQPDLTGLLNQIIGEGHSRLLKDNGVQYHRELRGGELGEFVSSETGRVDVPDNIIYLARPSLPTMKVIAKQIDACIKAGTRSQYHIYFVPHRTVACEQMLEDEGVLEHCEIGEVHLGLVPFDSDLLSLEMEGVFRQCYVDGDTSSLNVVARALHRLQSSFGTIPHVKSKGAASRKVLQKLLHLRREEDGSQGAAGLLQGERAQMLAVRGEIDTLVVMDREVDLVSPLVTPLTYEGLVDELIGITNGCIKLDASVLGDDKDDQLVGPEGSKMPLAATTEASGGGAPESSTTPRSTPGEMSLALNNSDMIFAEIRDLSIERLAKILQDKAKSIKERYDTFRDNKGASISEIHDFVKKIPQLTKDYKSLNQHINIAKLLKQTTGSRDFCELWQGERGMLEGELYIDQIEEMICADTDRVLFFRVVRLLCLQSLTAGGIRSNKLDAIRRLVVQTYGYEHLFTLSNLERAGLLKRKDLMLVDTAPPWQGLRKQLRLIDDRIDMSRPDDASYVSAGYAPLSVRLVQTLATTGWRALADNVMRLLPGPMLEFTQTSIPEELPEALARSAASSSSSSYSASADGSLAPSVFSSIRDEEGGKKIMLVFIVGGLSFLEVAAFRFLSRDASFPYQIVLATTKLSNGASLLKSLSHTNG